MGLLEKLKNYAGGVALLRDWVGENSAPIAPADAQARADICATCPANIAGIKLADSVADAIKKQLEFKNHLELRVEHEERLHTCSVCDCNLPLMVWCPDRLFIGHYTRADAARYPGYCWKRKLIERNIYA
jgi:hypothetical protein